MNALDMLYIPAAVLTAPVWLRKARGGWRQRLGHVASMLEGGDGVGRPRLLLHAVSVGEANALRRLVPLLARDARVIVSATTDTGLARSQALYGDVCDVVRYPLDLSSSVDRFLDAVRPDAVGLVELELWPNFLGACRRRRIPVCVVNGRLSERSFRRYRRWTRWTRPLFESLDFACVQDPGYAERFEAMGVEPHDCLLTGSMKWDAGDVSGAVREPSDEARRLGDELGIDRGSPLVVGGSTGPGEEALLHQACPDGAQLLCAPRRPERFGAAAQALPGCARRTAGAPRARGGRPRRFLLDTIGELGLAYELADVVVVGRSFGDLYGSDPIEPAALGRPVVIGPRVDDFRAIVEALDEAGGIVRTDRDGLAGVLERLLADPDERARLAARGRGCIGDRQGASARHAELLLELAAGSRPRAGTESSEHATPPG